MVSAEDKFQIKKIREVKRLLSAKRQADREQNRTLKLQISQQKLREREQSKRQRVEISQQNRLLARKDAQERALAIKKKKNKVDWYALAKKVKSSQQQEAEYQRDKRDIALQQSENRYKKTFEGRVGSKIKRGLQFIRRPSATLHARKMPSQGYSSSSYTGGYRRTVSGSGSSGKGRPRGTYDPRYAKYGGVYGYRKYMANQLRIQRIEAMRRSVVNPRQQEIINQIEQRDQARMRSPEARTFPDTAGRVPMRGIMEEIDFSANLVP